MGQQITFTKRQETSIVKAYMRKRDPISSNQLADDYGTTPAVIRRVLRNAGVTLRGPGRYATA